MVFQKNLFFTDFYLKKKQAIANVINQISRFNDTCVFFVSSKKVNKIIPELKKNFSRRKIVFCREISKLYEEFIRTNVDDLKTFDKELKGELTIVISEKKIDKNYSQELSESDINIIKKMINKLTIKEITEIISQNKSISKKEIYNYCLKIKNEI